MKPIVELFLTFCKIGLFTFGGGYAMISVVEDQCVERKKWITQEEMVQMTVLAESTPGPVAINAATYVGFQRAGLSGAAAATLGVVLPSFGVIFLISQFLEGFLEIPLIASAFQGIKLGVRKMSTPTPSLIPWKALTMRGISNKPSKNWEMRKISPKEGSTTPSVAEAAPESPAR